MFIGTYDLSASMNLDWEHNTMDPLVQLNATKSLAANITPILGPIVQIDNFNEYMRYDYRKYQLYFLNVHYRYLKNIINSSEFSCLQMYLKLASNVYFYTRYSNCNLAWMIHSLLSN